MRKFILYPILLALPFSACNETCDAVVLADLAFQSGVVSALVNQNTATYEISSTVVNALAKSCSDEGSVQRTNPSVLQQQIFYSSTPDFATKKVVDTYSFKTPELTGGQTTKDVDEIQFLEDGQYIL